MADGSIKIDTKLEKGSLDKDLKSIKGDLDKTSKSITTGFNLSKAAVVGFAGAAVVGITKAVKVLEEYNKLSMVQIAAERSLAQAAKNNPYLSGDSVNNLKAFASELQKVTNYGDEVTIGLMAQLAAAGRTEAEIQRIVTVAADLAASGTMSFDGAVKNLNKSFSGLAGELGEVIPELKNLTAEQMKSGAALDVIGKKYAGQAAAVQDLNVQLANSVGDLKETLGADWGDVISPLKKALKELIDTTNEAILRRRALKEASEIVATEKGTRIEILNAELLLLKEQQEQLKLKNSLEISEAGEFSAMGKAAQKRYEIESKALADNIKQKELALQWEKDLDSQRQKGVEGNIKAAESIAEENDRNKKAAEFIAQVNAEIKKNLEVLEAKARLSGQEVTDAERRAIYEAGYIKLTTESNGLITERNAAARALQVTIMQLNDATEKQTELQALLNTTEEEYNKILVKTDAGLQTEEEEREAILALIQNQSIELIKLGATPDGTDEKSEALRKYIVLMKQFGKTVAVIQPATEKGVRNLVLSFVDGAKNVAVQACAMVSNAGKVVVAGIQTIGGLATRAFGGIKSALVNIVRGAFSLLSAAAKFDPYAMLKSLDEFLTGLQNFFTVDVSLAPEWGKAGLELIKSFLDGMVEKLPTLVNTMKNAIIGLAKEIVKHAPDIFTSATKIVFGMASAIKEAAPNLASAAVSVIKAFASFLLDSAPAVIAMAGTLISEFTKEMISAAPEFLKKLEDSMPAIVSTMTTAIGNALNGLADLIIEYAPGMIEAAGKLIMGILQGIANAAPKLVKAALTIVMSLVNFVLKNLPMIIKLGMKILTAIILGLVAALPDILNAIADALPTIIDAIVEIIPLLIEALIAALPDIVEALVLITPLLMAALFVLNIKLILAIIEHLDDIVLAIIAALPLVVKAIIDAFATILKTYIALALDLYDTGMNIIQGLINGITDGANKLLAGIGQLFYDWIVTPVKNMFGIHSPSTVFAGVGGDMIQGLIDGIKSVGSGAWNAVSSVFSGLWDNVKSVFSGALDFGKGIVSSLSSGLSGAASAAQKAVGTVASGAQAVASGAANIAQTAISAVVSGAKAAGNLASTAASTVSSVASSAASSVVSGIKKLKFWAKGTNSAPGGLSVVGEAGTELITTPGGQAALAMGGTLVNLPQGSSVLNARDTQAALSLSSLAGSFGSSRIGSSLPTINILATLKTYLDEREIGRAAFEQMDVLAGGAFGY
jgi:phage-related protein